MKTSAYHLHFGPSRIGITAYPPRWKKTQPPNYRPLAPHGSIVRGLTPEECG